MAAAFSFSFAGDDIEEDSQDHQNGDAMVVDGAEIRDQGSATSHSQKTTNVPVSRLDIQELLASLPSSISYNTTLVRSPIHGRQMLVPRRALFDVRVQIMAESTEDVQDVLSPEAENAKTQPSPDARSSRSWAGDDKVGLGASDIEKDVYEGGFKSWEGAMDLARVLLDRVGAMDSTNTDVPDAIIELGCGTALPSLILLASAITNELAIPFVFADYNASVLRLVTTPNILLTWAMQHEPAAFSPRPPALVPSHDSHHEILDGDGELSITSELIQSFYDYLQANGPSIDLISGPWGPELVQTIASCAPAPAPERPLLLAAETIYSPASTIVFADTLLAILSQSQSAYALVATKRIYFGVGGGADAFKELVAWHGGRAVELEGSGIPECDGTGVGRCLLVVHVSAVLERTLQ